MGSQRVSRQVGDLGDEAGAGDFRGGLNVDLAPDGTVYGIELLNANEQLRGREAGKLIVENVATGTSAEVDLLKN